MKKLALLLLLLLVSPVLAGGNHHSKPEPTPAPTPLNVPDDGSNHNALAIAVVLAAGVCIYYKCWQARTALDPSPSRITPEIPQNEFTFELRQ